MTHRRTRAKPSAATDWRALAKPPAQRRLPLPVAADGDDAADAELTVRNGPDGRTRVVLIASATWTDPSTVRDLADALHDAADALDEPGGSDESDA